MSLSRFLLLLVPLLFALEVNGAETPTTAPRQAVSRAVSPKVTREIVLSPELCLRQIGEGAFVIAHQFPFLGNSLLVEMPDGTFVMAGTPWTPEATEQVLAWLHREYGERKLVAIDTGYHVDNLGGNEALLKSACPVYGCDLTVKLLAERGEKIRSIILDSIKDKKSPVYQKHATMRFVPPDQVFPASEGLRLNFGGEEVLALYPGPSQAPDKIAVYFPGRRLLFGSCMLIPGNKPGNIADADMKQWPQAIRSLLKLPLDAAVSSHGPNFDPSLVQHTLDVLLATK